MILPDAHRFAVMKTTLGRILLEQLQAVAWDRPTLRTVENIGAAFGTHIGSRRSRNEDRLALGYVTAASGSSYCVAIVCDGVGGSEMGDAAATVSIASFFERIATTRTEIPLAPLVIRTIKAVDNDVREALGGRGATTLSVLMVAANGDAVAANVGDSRVFAWHAGKSLTQISTDDTIENELKQLNLGDSPALDFHRLRGGLSQAIGEVGRSAEELRIIPLKSHLDRGIILASDGAWKSDEVAFSLVTSHAPTAGDAMKRVLSLSAWTGGLDNVSIIAIEDIRKFAEPLKHLDVVETGVSSATVWVGDEKFTVLGNKPRANVVRKIEPSRSVVEQGEAREVQQLFPAVRRRVRVRKPADQDLQLEIGEDRKRPERSIIDRPKIEISSDDEDSLKNDRN